MSQTPQHLAALQRGNMIRVARAELRRRVGAGELDVADLLAGTLDELEVTTHAGTATAADALRGARILDVVQWAHRFGPGRANRVLYNAGVSPRARIIDLTRRQREELPHAFRVVAGERPAQTIPEVAA